MSGRSRVDEVGSDALLEVHEHEDEHRQDEEVEGRVEAWILHVESTNMSRRC